MVSQTDFMNDCKKYYFAPPLAFFGVDGGRNGDTSTMDFEMTTTTTRNRNNNTTSPMRQLNENLDEDKDDPTVDACVKNGTSNTAALTTWKGILQTNRQLYDMACWTGIIYPVPIPEAVNCTHSGLTAEQILYRQWWTIIMHIALLVTVLSFIIIIPFMVVAPYYQHSTDDDLSGDTSKTETYEIYAIFSALAGYLPLFTMYGGMITLRKSIAEEIPLFHQSLVESNSNNSIDRKQSLLELDCVVIIQQCIAQKLPFARKLIAVFVLLASIYLFFFFIYITYLLAKNGSNNVNGQPAFYVASYIISMTLYFASIPGVFPSVLMILGILTFVLIEQRVSYFTMLHLRSLAMQSLLTDTDYITAGKDMNYRDSISPLNWLFVGAVLDSALCIFMLYAVAYGNNISINQSISLIELLVVMFCQELTVLLVILYEVLCVNEMIDVLLIQTTKQRVIDHNRRMMTSQSFVNALITNRKNNGRTDSTSPSSLLTFFPSTSAAATDSVPSSVNTEDMFIELMEAEEKRFRRLELHLLVKEQRIGTTILFVYRPSKVELMVQMSSIVIALASSLLKLLVKSVTH